jgi:hypothetical protein
MLFDSMDVQHRYPKASTRHYFLFIINLLNKIKLHFLEDFQLPFHLGGKGRNLFNR